MTKEKEKNPVNVAKGRAGMLARWGANRPKTATIRVTERARDALRAVEQDKRISVASNAIIDAVEGRR